MPTVEPIVDRLREIRTCTEFIDEIIWHEIAENWPCYQCPHCARSIRVYIVYSGNCIAVPSHWFCGLHGGQIHRRCTAEQFSVKEQCCSSPCGQPQWSVEHIRRLFGCEIDSGQGVHCLPQSTKIQTSLKITTVDGILSTKGRVDKLSCINAPSSTEECQLHRSRRGSPPIGPSVNCIVLFLIQFKGCHRSCCIHI